MKIFISHARSDKEWAKNLVDQLKSQGLQAWIDEYELHPGEPWEEQIKNALIESDTFIAILNEGQPSPNVLFEMGMALEQGKRVMPVIIGKHSDTSVIEDLPHTQAIRAEQVEQAAKKIVEAASKDVGLS